MPPRQILPRQFYLITRRCCQRQLLLRPDPATNNAFLYCLIAAALRCEIDVLLPCAMSNHRVRQRPRAVAYRRARRVPDWHLLAPPVRVGAGAQDMISSARPRS